MFGRKKVTPTPAQQIQQQNNQEFDQRTDDAIAILSQALGLDLEFDIAYIFSPSLWDDPALNELLSGVGIQPEMKGNKMALLKNPETVKRIAAMGPDEPVRKTLIDSGFGVVQFDPLASNRYDDGLTAMQRDALREIAVKYPGPEARQYAVFDLLKFSHDVMKGLVKLG